jgi:thymidylate kinase
MDRSIISSMLYIKSQDKFFETKKIKYHQRKVKEEIKNGNIIIPWVFFLNINIETQLERSKKDQNRDSSFLLSRCFYKFQKEQFEILSREYPNFIFVIDGERKLEEVITEINEKIKNLKDCTPKIDFENFCSYLFN